MVSIVYCNLQVRSYNLTRFGIMTYEDAIRFIADPILAELREKGYYAELRDDDILISLVEIPQPTSSEPPSEEDPTRFA